LTKVLFLINTLGGGGAERVLVNLVNNMDRSRFDITVKTMFKGGVNEKRLDPAIRYECKHAPLFRGIAKAFCLIPASWLYRYFVGNEPYDILVAYMHGAPVKVIAGCPDKRVKKAAWLHTGNPARSTFFDFWFSKKKAFAAYASCDAVVGISETVRDAFSDFTGITDNMALVYNTNDTARILEQATADPMLGFERTRPMICSVGRAVPEKGYDRLIDVAVRLTHEGYRFDLVIVGDGEQLLPLQAQVEQADAGSYIHLLGFRDNPYPVMKAADVFVCSSRQEGFSTVVAESMILGTPVVSTEVSGAKETLGAHDEYGIVVPNSEEGIYTGLKRVLDDRDVLEAYRKKTAERAAFFSTQHTVRQAEDLLDSLMNSTMSES